MFGLVSLLIILVLSILINRVATIALVHTGLSTEVARFQARSALTGAGFTTSESERLVNHPVRRRIIMTLMLLGNAGVITVISSLILTFVRQGSDNHLLTKLLVLLAGLVGLWLFAQSRFIDRHLSRLIDWALRHSTHLEIRDFSGLLGVGDDHEIAELQVRPEDWLANRTLRQASLQQEGVLVLAIKRANGRFFGAPGADMNISPEDTLILYGARTQIAELDRRRASRGGDREHARAMEERDERVQEEISQDREDRSGSGENSAG